MVELCLRLTGTRDAVRDSRDNFDACEAVDRATGQINAFYRRQ